MMMMNMTMMMTMIVIKTMLELTLLQCGRGKPLQESVRGLVRGGRGETVLGPADPLAAVRGPAGAGCVEEGRGGRNSIDQEGNNSWRDGALNGTSQSYLVMTVRMLGGRREVETELQDPDRARQVIDGLLCDQ